MQRPFFWITVLGMCLGTVQAAPPKPLVVIESTKSYARGTLPCEGAWLGLYCNGSDCEIREAAVKVTSSTAKPITGMDEAIDALHVTDTPLALFHGTVLKPGKVDTWFKAEKSVYDSRAYTQLQRLGRWQIPGGATPLTISWVKLPGGEGFRYHIGDGKERQFLFATSTEGHYGGSLTPIVYWAGDLDGDGKADLLLLIPYDNCGYDERLYLSSLATGKEFIRKAAQLSGTEAACGC